MDVTKPYKFIRFGAMDATKPYEFIGFGANDPRMPGIQVCLGPGYTRGHGHTLPGPGVHVGRMRLEKGGE